MKEAWMVINPPEASRTYVFPYKELRFLKISRIFVSKSGTHYIEHVEGKSIIPPKWICINLGGVDRWTYPYDPIDENKGV